jgi:hypothetical protein
LRLRTAGGDAEHSFSRLPPAAIANLSNLTSEFQSRNIRWIARRRWIATHSLKDICAIQSGGTNAHECVPAWQCRISYITNFQYVRIARTRNHNRFHEFCNTLQQTRV